MTLATHILFAGAVTKPFIGRLGGLPLFLISAASHYLADAIPHFDYKLLAVDMHDENPDVIDKSRAEIKFGAETLAIDLLNIAIDIAIGSSLLIILARPEASWANFWAYGGIIIGSILPDALQPVFIIWKKFPMTALQDLHDFWHAKLRLKLNKTAVISQAALFLISALIIRS